MARRKIHTTRITPRCVVNILRDAEYGEYVVQAVVDGKVVGGRAGGGAFTNDKKDARGTAAAMVRQLRRDVPACRRR